MQFKSKAQRRFLATNHPAIAKRWDKETGAKPLPERIGPTKEQKALSMLGRGMAGKSR